MQLRTPTSRSPVGRRRISSGKGRLDSSIGHDGRLLHRINVCLHKILSCNFCTHVEGHRTPTPPPCGARESPEDPPGGAPSARTSNRGKLTRAARERRPARHQAPPASVQLKIDLTEPGGRDSSARAAANDTDCAPDPSGCRAHPDIVHQTTRRPATYRARPPRRRRPTCTWHHGVFDSESASSRSHSRRRHTPSSVTTTS